MFFVVPRDSRIPADRLMDCWTAEISEKLLIVEAGLTIGYGLLGNKEKRKKGCTLCIAPGGKGVHREV